MKKSAILLIIGGILHLSLFGQEINTPVELIGIIEASDISYDLQPLNKTIVTPDRSKLLNNNNYFVHKNHDTTSIREYKYSKSNKLQIADSLFKKLKYTEARKIYLDILEQTPQFYKAITLIGKTYNKQKNTEQAIKWFTKAVKLNPIDFEANHELAKLCFMSNQTDLAKKHILQAHIYNINHHEIISELINVFSANQHHCQKWTFTPQIELEQQSDSEYVVYYKIEWFNYAIAKTMWQIEPGYRESRDTSLINCKLLEERECLTNLIMNLQTETDEVLSAPINITLLEAEKQGLLDAFIFYEIILPNKPEKIYSLNPKTINDIKRYILEVRCKQLL